MAQGMLYIHSKEAQEHTSATVRFGTVLANGHQDISPDLPATVKGYKPQTDKTDLPAIRVTHSGNDGGLISTGELEIRATGSPVSSITPVGVMESAVVSRPNLHQPYECTCMISLSYLPSTLTDYYLRSNYGRTTSHWAAIPLPWVPPEYHRLEGKHAIRQLPDLGYIGVH